jgi:hypothetical protein
MFLVGKHNPKRSAFLDTRLVEGTAGMADELGHFRLDPAVVADTAGIAKIDPQRMLDSPALEQHGLRDREGPPRMHDIVASFSERKASDLLVDVGKLFGHALAGPMRMLNLHRIIITGALAHEDVKRGCSRSQAPGAARSPTTPRSSCSTATTTGTTPPAGRRSLVCRVRRTVTAAVGGGKATR